MDAPKTLHEGRKEEIWGIDLSTAAINVGWTTLDGTSRGVKRIDWPPNLKHGQRLAAAYASIRTGTWSLAQEHPPIAVIVEQPSGAFNKPQLSYLCGIVQAAVHAELEDFYSAPIHVSTMTPGEWKKGVLGTAGKTSYKPKKNDPREYLAVTVARELGYEGMDWDDADAWCLTEHARRSLAFS